MPKLERRNLLTLAVIAILVFALVVSIRLVGRQIRLFTGAAGELSKISFSTDFANSTQTTTVGQRISIPIWIDTNNADIGGVDVLVRYDHTKLRLETITTDPANSTTLDTFAPVVSTNVGQFDSARVITTANNSGLIEFGAVTYQATPDPGVITAPFRGVAQLAMLEFTALGTDPGSVIRFDASQNSTTDTNMVTTGTVQDLFANTSWNATDNRISEMTVIINSTASTTPSPTVTSGVTPTVTLTPTQIPSSTPTPTTAILPTPTSTTGSTVNFQIKFQNITSKTTNKSDKFVTVVLKQGSTTVQTFDNVNTVANASTGIYSGTLTSVNPGIYDIYIKGPVHLNKKITSSPVTVSTGSNSFDWSTISLIAGDVAEDNTIQLSDVTGVISVWITPSTSVNLQNQKYDLNGDNFISISDINIITSNWTTSIVNGD